MFNFRTWTEETCESDFKDVFIGFYSNKTNRDQLVDDLKKAYNLEADQPAMKGVDEEQWFKDVKTFVYGGFDAALASMSAEGICNGVYGDRK